MTDAVPFEAVKAGVVAYHDYRRAENLPPQIITDGEARAILRAATPELLSRAMTTMDSTGDADAHRSTLHHRGTAAEICRLRGWAAGTLLVGDEGYGPTVIEITAVGDKGILAKRLGHAGHAVYPYEGSWVLWCREWREASKAEVPVPIPVGSRVEISPELAGTITTGPDSHGLYGIDCGEQGRWVLNPSAVASFVGD